MLHLPSYSRGGERIQQKATISGHLQRESLLNENRKARPCHTLHTSAARICTPEGVKSATHAQRRNSCRSGACPNVQIPYPCRLRRRQGPPKNGHNHCAARKWARPPCKTLCQPAARRSARDAGRQTTKSRQTPPPPQDPPICCSRSKKGGGPGRGAGTCEPQPPPLGRLFPITRGL